jgi:hypothetical protein
MALRADDGLEDEAPLARGTAGRGGGIHISKDSYYY